MENVEYFYDLELIDEYFTILVDNFELIINSLNSIYLILMILLSFGLAIVITLVIYSVLKKYFY